MNHAEAKEVLHEMGAEHVLQPEVFDRFAELIREDPALMWPMVLGDDVITYATAGTLSAFGDMLPHTRLHRGS